MPSELLQRPPRPLATTLQNAFAPWEVFGAPESTGSIPSPLLYKKRPQQTPKVFSVALSL